MTRELLALKQCSNISHLPITSRGRQNDNGEDRPEISEAQVGEGNNESTKEQYRSHEDACSQTPQSYFI